MTPPTTTVFAVLGTTGGYIGCAEWGRGAEHKRSVGLKGEAGIAMQ